MSERDFEDLLRQHRGIVFKIANSYSSPGVDREDLVQEICLQLWRAFPGYDPARLFSTWLYRVALNTAISMARSRYARERWSVPLEESEAAAIAQAPHRPEQEDRLARLHHTLQGLPELDRALVLLYLEERSYREIAEILGISETNVGTKLDRLKQRMRRDQRR